MKNIKTRAAFSITILMTLFLLSSNIFAAKFFRWTDDNGKIHYSYTLPPTTSQQGYTKINETGRQVEVVSAVEKVTKSSSMETVIEKTDSQKEIEEQTKKHDNYLLSTYIDLDELTEVYLKRQKTLNDQVELYNQRVVKLNKVLTDTKALERKTKKKSDKEKLKKYILTTTESLKVYGEMIADNQQKLEQLNQIYQSDKARLTQLLSDTNNKEKVKIIK